MRRLGLLAAILAMQVAGQEPAAVQLALSSSKSDFNLGETVALQLRFTATTPKTFVAYSGNPRGFEAFVADQSDGIEDPLQGNAMGMAGGLGGPALLSDKPLKIELFLNDVVRFRSPGTYRLHAVSQRIGRVAHPEQLDMMRLYAPGITTHMTLNSNSITLQIHAAPADWVQEQIATASKFLDGPLTGVDYEARQRAVRTLRYLNTADAARALAARMNNGGGVRYQDLRDTAYPSQVLAVLERRLTGSGEAIDSEYLAALAELAETVAEGPMRRYSQDEAKHRIALQDVKHAEYTRRLIAALPSKQAVPRAESEAGLFGDAHRSRTRPEWLGVITAQLIAHFRLLPATMQANLLSSEYAELETPAMLPVLREIYASGKDADLALRRIYAIAPDEGRRFILEEIRHPQHHRITPATLAMLPEATLPELGEVLATAYEIGMPDAEWLLVRYGTGAILEPVKEAYMKRSRERKDAWAGVIVYYFLKHDPAFGQQEMRRSMAVSGGPPIRYDIAFQIGRYGAWATSPALENLAIEFLSSSSVPVKKGAAEMLGKYGSGYAKEPLWRTMEFFRSWWKGREEELLQPVGEEGRGFERTLVTALQQGEGWVLTDGELAKLVELCSSPSCREDVQRQLAVAKTPILVQAGSGRAFPSSIGPYGLSSDDQFRKRLRQYPAGTPFRMVWTESSDDRQARERTEATVRESGHRLVP